MVEKPRVLGYGSALIDAIAHVDDAFLAAINAQKGGTVSIDAATLARFRNLANVHEYLSPGGACANTLVALARLGQPAALMANLGDDQDGHTFLEAMKLAGVNTSNCHQHPGHKTGTCVTFVTPDAERTMRSFLGDESSVPPTIFKPEDFNGFSHFFVEGYTFRHEALMRHLLKSARQANLTICLDLNSPEVTAEHHPVVKELLTDFVDVVFANKLEAKAFAQCDDIYVALGRLAQCCSVAVVKLGVDGCIIKETGKHPVHVPAFPANALDTTGAGDFWAGGFLFSWLRGDSLETAAKIGAKVAAEIVQINGTQLPESTWDKLKEQFRNF